MRIITWNVFNQNSDYGAIVGFVENSGADVLALQELTTEHIAYINKNSDFSWRTARDFIENDAMTFLGLFSKHRIASEKIVPFPRASKYSPSPIGQSMKWQECFDAHSITIIQDDVPLTIVNIHLTNAARPSVRLRELEIIVENFLSDHRIVICGDFNTFASPLLNIFIGRQYGFQAKDYCVRELSRLRHWAADHNLYLVPNRSPTFAGHKLLGFQFDHFLVRGVKVLDLRVMPKAFGSDHYPVVLEVDLL